MSKNKSNTRLFFPPEQRLAELSGSSKALEGHSDVLPVPFPPRLPLICWCCRDCHLHHLDVSATNTSLVVIAQHVHSLWEIHSTSLNVAPPHQHVYEQHLYLNACLKYLERASLLNSCRPAGSDRRGDADHSGISPQCQSQVTCGHTSWGTVTWACPGCTGPTPIWWRNQGSCFWPAESFCAWLQAKTGSVPLLLLWFCV